MKVSKSLVKRGTFSTEARNLLEKTFQMIQCEEDVQLIHKNDDDVSETVMQVSSNEEDLDLDFIRVLAYNSDCEVEL